ncbi:unnamed protein product [Prorocentrum cordatum]|uniref:Uncharacterized protein n=1 Tax=Prorocentrum cordatum TaxID=2364126 RepID=A0ABN9X3D3_9DINO|nr:unnamed protein product [Polarella glacialis]
MAGRTTSQGPSVYNDGWRQGRYNLWMEEQMGGNWMNITQLKEYTHPSGRLKSRYLTKLFMSNHNRAMIYIKRLQCLGLMPYHRIQAKMANDPAALPPPPKVQFNSGGERPAQSRQLLGQDEAAAI